MSYATTERYRLNLFKQFFTSGYIIDQTNDLTCRPDACFLVPFSKDPPTSDTSYKRLNFFEIWGCRILFDLNDLLSDRVLSCLVFSTGNEPTLKIRQVFLKVLMINAVSLSVDFTSSSLMDSWIGASFVAMNLVPMLILCTSD
jgi:hypothetical protein